MIKCQLQRCLCVRLIKRETKTIFSFLQYTAQELKQAAKSGIRCSFQRCLPRNPSSHFRNNPKATFTHSFITPVPCCCCRHTPGLQGKRKKTGSLPPTACVLSPPPPDLCSVTVLVHGTVFSRFTSRHCPRQYSAPSI